MKRRNFLKIFAAAPLVPVLAKTSQATIIGIDPALPGADKTVFDPSIASQLHGMQEITPLPVKHGPNIWSQDLLNKFYRDLVDNMALSKDMLGG